MQKKAVEGLFWDLVRGVSWETFSGAFAQCLICRAVVLREAMFSQHRCAGPTAHHNQHPQEDREPVKSATNSRSRVRMRLRRVNGRLVSVHIGTGEPGDPIRTYSVHPRRSASTDSVVPDSEPEAEA